MGWSIGSEEAHGTLIDAIYEAGALPQLWPDLLARLADSFHAKGGLLLAPRGESTLSVTSPKLEPYMSAYMREGWMERSDRAVRLFDHPPHAGFVSDLDVYSGDEVLSLPVYTDFLIPNGLGSGVATMVEAGGGEKLLLTLEGTLSHAHSRQIIPDLDLLRPHLARASLLSARLHLERVRAAVEALAIIGAAAAMVDRNGHVLAANAAFEALLGRAPYDRRGRLTMHDHRADQLFVDALDWAGRGKGRSFPASLAGADMPVAIHMVPVRGAARDIFLDTRAVMIVSRPQQPAVPAADLIQALFDLTPSEARVARRIAEGHTPQAIAYSSGVGVATIRSQLKSVFQKTGAARQADLVRLLMGVSAPIAAASSIESPPLSHRAN